MKNFIKVTTDKGCVLVNTSKIRTVKPVENGAEIILEEFTTSIGYKGTVKSDAVCTRHDFVYAFKNRAFITQENFDTVLMLIEQAQ